MSNYLTPYAGMTAIEALAHDLKRPVEAFEQPLGLRNLIDRFEQNLAHTFGIPPRLLYGYYDPPVVPHQRHIGISVLDDASFIPRKAWRQMIGDPKGSRGWRRHVRRMKAKARCPRGPIQQ